MDARRITSPFMKVACFRARVNAAVRRFLLKKLNGKIADLKTKTLRVKINLREGKRRAEDDDTPNKSLDVRRKQRLCYQRVF